MLLEGRSLLGVLNHMEEALHEDGVERGDRYRLLVVAGELPGVVEDGVGGDRLRPQHVDGELVGGDDAVEQRLQRGRAITGVPGGLAGRADVAPSMVYALRRWNAYQKASSDTIGSWLVLLTIVPL